MVIALRDDFQDFALDIGILGREALRIDGSDPRWISELLIGNLDPGGDPFGGDHWLEEYTSIREGNLLLARWQTAEQLTPEEISATSGFVKTIQALAFTLVLDTHTQDSIPIAIPLDVTAPPAPFVTNAAAWDSRDQPAGRRQHRAGRGRRRVPVHLARRLPRVRHPGHLRHLQPGAPGPGGGLSGGLERRADGAGRIVPHRRSRAPTCSAAST